MGTIGRTSYRIGDQNALHFITITTVEWVDIFTRKKYKDIVIDSLKYCQEHKGLEIFSYVLMSNHIHMICRAIDEFELSDILRDFKRHTAKYIIKNIKENTQESRKEWILKILEKVGSLNKKNKTYQFWRQDNHPIELFKPETIQQKVEYIHNNPVRSGIVSTPEDYLFSSAKNYAKLENILEVKIIDLLWKTQT